MPLKVCMFGALAKVKKPNNLQKSTIEMVKDYLNQYAIKLITNI